MTTILITGAGRGIGKELTQQYVSAGVVVLGACRTASAATDLARDVPGANLKTMVLDVTDQTSVSTLQQDLADTRIDILINNAGVMGGRQSFGDMDYDDWMKTFAVNTMGPLRITEALTGQLADGAKVVTISSMMGALSRNTSGTYAYRSTKAAVNKVVQLMANDLKPRGIACIAMHPGWVQTDMGGPAADIGVEESAAGIRAVIDELTLAKTGQFIQWNGESHGW